MSKNGSLSTFILGGLCGAVLGVLFAPRPGYESREILIDRALDYWDNADDFYDAASDRAVEIYATSRDVAIDATEQVRSKIEAARTRLIEEVESVSDKAATEKAAIGAASASARKAVEPYAVKAKEKLGKIKEEYVAAKGAVEAKIPEAVEVDVIVEEKPVAKAPAKAPAKKAAPKKAAEGTA